MQHFIDKFDSYLGKLLGVLVIAVGLLKITDNEYFLMFLKYFCFLMIAVAAFDIMRNLMDHESAFWKGLAIISNLFTILICVLLLQEIVGYLNVVLRLADFVPFITLPNFYLYLGAVVIVENMLWSYLFEHM